MIILWYKVICSIHAILIATRVKNIIIKIQQQAQLDLFKIMQHHLLDSLGRFDQAFRTAVKSIRLQIFIKNLLWSHSCP
ncbi:hypothetical protein FGO68_gene4374 [Halteria grandinella]|uniref:Uncharacterized protein n=1 Tax=Halteria grandinella TaxID=5974 RepID=A0A8J8NJK5_HALGN|nr:hypothetical protein FGO68_gene4374 [Halteria grandinella]